MNHSLFILPLAIADWFDAAADQLGNNGPAVVRCISASGKAPATHGWCGVALTEEKENEVAAFLASNPKRAALVTWVRYDLAKEPARPFGELKMLGLQVICERPANG
ncbi:MAG: hypothetical protein ABMA26_15075 [Limisphaerales bacterium]